jgi:hypothetical protein
VVTGVSRTLRCEQRQFWRRLLRALEHEINSSAR